ncbi:exported hypothetical protein [Candidatus Sulfopaludibacter sp. SbA4]|nr:exported hypothetical protein [Candidatus Sulfopaludibacter sp. SbA4]
MLKATYFHLLFALTTSALSSQAQPAEHKLCVLEGRTLNSLTGQPISKINVTIQQRERVLGQSAPAGPTTVTTDTQGHFSFEGLPAGRYALYARRNDGLYLADYGARLPGEPGTLVALEPSDHKEVEFRIVPRGTLAGSVVDSDGDPVRRATLLITALGAYGQERWTDGHGYQTNDRGEFRVYDMEPGKYCVLAVPPPSARACCTPEAAAAEIKHAATALLPTYYPSAPDLAAAARVDLPPGQELSNIRITLREGRVYHVRGKVTGGTPPPKGLTIMLYPRDYPVSAGPEMFTVLSERLGNPRAVTPDGKFDLADVEPGPYEVAAIPSARDRGTLGRAEIVVKDQDANDVVLPLNALVKLSVAVRVEGAEAADLSGGFMLWPLDSRLHKTAGGSLDVSGHAQINDIVPGQYRPRISIKPKDVYIKSLRLRSAAGSNDVLESGLDLNESSSAGTLEMLLSADGGTVSGMVRKGDAPAPSRQLYLLPDIPNSERSPNFKVVMSDGDGRFAFTGVAPGDYRLYAWEDITAGVSLELDAAFRRRYWDSGTKVSVHAHESTQTDTAVVEAR